MTTRQMVDRIVITLLVCILMALTVGIAVFAITTELATSYGYLFNAAENSDIVAGELAYAADKDDPLATYAIECGRDMEEFKQKVMADSRYEYGIGLEYPMMYNYEHKIAVGSLNHYWSALYSDSDYYSQRIESEEFKEAFPATSMDICFDGKRYEVYYAGCREGLITEFANIGKIEQDEKELGKIFRIEERNDEDEELEVFILSTGASVNKAKPLSVPFEMTDYKFEFSYSVEH